MAALPPGWHRRKLGEIASIRYGLGVPPEPSDAGVPMIRATNVKRGRISSLGLLRINVSRLPKNKDAFLKQGDIIVVRSGAYAGDSAIVTSEWAGSVAGYDLIVSVNVELEPTFVAFWLLSEEFHVYFKGHRDRSAQPHLNRQQVSNAELSVPPRDEQFQIARLLSAVQRAIKRQERLIAVTAELKKALMQKLFTEGTRGESLKQTEIGTVPKSWNESRLGSVVRFSSGGTPSREVNEYWHGGSIPWVKTSEIDYCTITSTEERITQLGLNNSSAKLLPAGTLLMAMYGQGITRGRVAILGIDAASNQACAAFTPRSEDEISTHFLYYFLEFHYEDLRQRSHGANQANLSITLLKGFPVYYPRRDQQDAIVQALRALDNKLNVHGRYRIALASLFRTLLHQLMTAQVRVHDLDLSALGERIAEAAGVV